MPFWERGDLVVSLNGSSGARTPIFVSFSIPDGTLRNTFSLPLPSDTTFINSPASLRIQPDNTLIWGVTGSDTGDTNFNDKIVYSNGEANDLRVDRPRNSNIGQMAFDSSGNRYMGDFDSINSNYIIRRVAPDNNEYIYVIPTSYIDDETVNGIGVPANRLEIAPDVSRVYWHAQPLFPFIPSIFTGFNRLDLSTGVPLRRYDVKDRQPTANEFSGLLVGPVTGYVYLFIGINNVTIVYVIDPTNDSILNQWQIGNSDCTAGNLAMNCDETILAFVHQDVGFTNIELHEPFSGDLIGIIDYEGQTGKFVYRGMTFAPCPQVSGGGFMPFVTLVGAT